MKQDFTRRREAVLACLAAADKPMSAAELQALVPEINLATVYRALRWLEEHRRITGFTFECREEGIVRYYSAKTHQHYLHCESCHCFVAWDGCGLTDSIHQLEERYGFTISGHVLYFTGLCANCKKA